MSISRMMPPKMAIQTIQVRGGTLNSPPFLGLFSSSLDLLSSGIFYFSWTKLTWSHLGRNARFKPRPRWMAGYVPLHHGDLQPFPLPMQAVFCRPGKLELFRNPMSFDPE